MRAPVLLVACAIALPVAGRAAAQAPEVQVSAVPEYAAVRAGSSFRVAVRLRIPEGWHIYWTNPGPGGLPTTVAWHLPGGVTAGETEWPFPETDESGGDITHVYRGTVVLFSHFQTGPDASGALRLTADLSWGICKAVCIQQKQSVFVVTRVAAAAGPRSSDWSEMEAARSRLPVHPADARFSAVVRGGDVALTVTGFKAAPPAGAWATFFPVAPGLKSAVAQVRGSADSITVVLPRMVIGSGSPGRLEGVLVAAHAPGALPPVRAIAVDVPVGP